MNSDIATRFARTGHERRRSGDFVEAGEQYTAVAHQYFSAWPDDRRGKKISQGAYFLLLAGTCYRLGGRTDRATARCEQGVLIAEEWLDRTKDLGGSAAYDRARYAAWHEYVGDFRLLGSLDGATEAYERAEQVYLDEGDPPLAHREQEHMWLVEFFEQVRHGAGSDDDEWQQFLREATLSNWVEYKRDHLPDALNELVSQSAWVPRGNE